LAPVGRRSARRRRRCPHVAEHNRRGRECAAAAPRATLRSVRW
jgi:hypothetical protein